VGTYTSIGTDTYTTVGYKWAHTQVYGQTHTQQHMGEHMHDKRTQEGTYTSMWVSTHGRRIWQTHTHETMVGCILNKSIEWK